MIGFLLNLIPNTLRGQVRSDVLSVAPSRKPARSRRRAFDFEWASRWSRAAGEAHSRQVEDFILGLEIPEHGRYLYVSPSQAKELQKIDIPEVADLRLRVAA